MMNLNGDARSWAETSRDVPEEGVPISLSDSDRDGHGTHAASVLSSTDPYCEIFIAKVFNGRQSEDLTASHEAVAKVRVFRQLELSSCI
jgi:hypothetical protein